jgi:hypothetical protein
MGIDLIEPARDLFVVVPCEELLKRLGIEAATREPETMCEAFASLKNVVRYGYGRLHESQYNPSKTSSASG